MRKIQFRTLAERVSYVFDVFSGKRKPLPAGTRLIVRPKQRRTIARAKPPRLARPIKEAKPVAVAQSLGAAVSLLSDDDPPDEEGGEPPPKRGNATPDLDRDGASKMAFGGETKNRRLSNKPSSKTQDLSKTAVYDGKK